LESIADQHSAAEQTDRMIQLADSAPPFEPSGDHHGT